MKRLLLVAIVVVALLPVVGYWLARSRGMRSLSAEARAALVAPLDALQRQARLLDGPRPDAAAVCEGNASRLRARVTCEHYVATMRARLGGFVGGTLDATSLQGDPRRDPLVLMGVASVGPHGHAEFSVRMTREHGGWRVADVIRYGRSLFP